MNKDSIFCDFFVSWAAHSVCFFRPFHRLKLDTSFHCHYRNCKRSPTYISRHSHTVGKHLELSRRMKTKIEGRSLYLRSLSFPLGTSLCLSRRFWTPECVGTLPSYIISGSFAHILGDTKPYSILWLRIIRSYQLSLMKDLLRETIVVQCQHSSLLDSPFN